MINCASLIWTLRNGQAETQFFHEKIALNLAKANKPKKEADYQKYLRMQIKMHKANQKQQDKFVKYVRRRDENHIISPHCFCYICRTHFNYSGSFDDDDEFDGELACFDDIDACIAADVLADDLAVMDLEAKDATQDSAESDLADVEAYAGLCLDFV
jgi:hypothetical protein